VNGLLHFAGRLGGDGGLWRFLIARVHARRDVELQRLRNEATVTALRLTPYGAELFESDPDGHVIVLRMPGARAHTLATPGTPINESGDRATCLEP
jgi:hypothetical protein